MKMKNLIVTLLILCSSLSMAQIAVKGGIIYTMDGKPVANGVILIKNGLIEAIGPASEITIPAGYTVYENKVVTPGLIDARTVMGLSGLYNQPHDQDQLEKSDPFQPELRAFDAFNPQEELLAYARQFGVTTINTGHAPGALASGQMMIAKTWSPDQTANIMDSASYVAFTLGSSVSYIYKKPGTRAKGISMLRQEFIRAQDYLKKKDDAPRDLKMETMASVLRGEIGALITANTSVEILAALRLAEEFGIKITLDGAAEASVVLNEIKKAGVPVILHAPMARSYGDLKNASLETASLLKKEGISFAIQSGYEGYVPKTRIILFEAAMAAANGLGMEAALESITIGAARILGIDKKVGSITKGRQADIVLFNGDPFEYTSKACTVIIDGTVVSNECK
ncbi:MAG: amidohydrolase family protein [Ignavibacteriales bacterium]|nr:MAG: amidohydrolase family protein [Ignavibacteriales bacterium]